MIHLFHGFLGSADDFSFLQGDGVILHDLYTMTSYPVVGTADILIGYSMGGRIALEIADKCNYQIKKIVLMNAHPGLSSDEARLSRQEFESKIIQELKSKGKDDFMAWWNELPIFNFDRPITSSDEHYRKSAELFDRYRLSAQIDHLPKMIQHKDKVLYLAGLLDEKYMELVSELLAPEDFNIKGIPAGHRLFQHPEELKHVLKTEHII